MTTAQQVREIFSTRYQILCHKLQNIRAIGTQCIDIECEVLESKIDNQWQSEKEQQTTEQDNEE